jgi:hypothetical protein
MIHAVLLTPVLNDCKKIEPDWNESGACPC